MGFHGLPKHKTSFHHPAPSPDRKKRGEAKNVPSCWISSQSSQRIMWFLPAISMPCRYGAEDFNRGHGQRSVHGFIDIPDDFCGGLNGFKKRLIKNWSGFFEASKDSLTFDEWFFLCATKGLDWNPVLWGWSSIKCTSVFFSMFWPHHCVVVFHVFFSIQYSGDYPINLYPCVAGLYPPIISHMAMWEIPVNSWFSIVMLNYWRVFVGSHLLNIPFLKGPFCQSLPIECRSYTSTSQWGGWQQNRSSIGVFSCFAPSVAVAKCLCNWVSGPMSFWDTLSDEHPTGSERNSILGKSQRPLTGMMVSKGNYPQMLLFEVYELLHIFQIISKIMNFCPVGVKTTGTKLFHTPWSLIWNPNSAIFKREINFPRSSFVVFNACLEIYHYTILYQYIIIYTNPIQYSLSLMM